MDFIGNGITVTFSAWDILWLVGAILLALDVYSWIVRQVQRRSNKLYTVDIVGNAPMALFYGNKDGTIYQHMLRNVTPEFFENVRTQLEIDAKDHE